MNYKMDIFPIHYPVSLRTKIQTTAYKPSKTNIVYVDNPYLMHIAIKTFLLTNQDPTTRKNQEIPYHDNYVPHI